MKLKTLLPLLTLLSLAACSLSGPASDFCVVTHPIYMDAGDVLTSNTLRQVVTFDETWEKLCK